MITNGYYCNNLNVGALLRVILFFPVACMPRPSSIRRLKFQNFVNFVNQDFVKVCRDQSLLLAYLCPDTQHANQLRKQGASVQFILDRILLVVEILCVSSTGNSEAGLNTSCLK